jgi:GNAT superfamily N-acetyltransferase
VVWQFYRSGQDVRLWEDAGRLAGFAAFEPPLVMQFDLRDDDGFDSGLAGEMLDWLEDRRRSHARIEEDVPVAYSMLADRSLSTEVLESDADRIRFLEGRGYRLVERHGLRFRRPLSESVVVPPLPPGMRLRHVEDEDIAERADLHRDAWSVWGPSSFSDDAYRVLRQQLVYDATLDIVLEDSGGRFLSYCICWADEASGVATFEPVGTRPSMAGQGLARLVIAEAIRRAQQRGLHTALVGTASVNARAASLYAACGFELVERQYSYSKEL